MNAMTKLTSAAVGEIPPYCPRTGCRTFIVSVYNAVVRALAKENASHHKYDLHWAEVQEREVVAANEDEALRLSESFFPESEGFVVTKVAVAKFA